MEHYVSPGTKCSTPAPRTFHAPFCNAPALRFALARFLLGRHAMRVAIPIFGDEISPRFCFAEHVLLLDLEGRHEVARQVLPLGQSCNPDRLRLLQSRGVTLLVCGGFDRNFLPTAYSLGIHVVWGVTGALEDAVRDVVTGKLTRPDAHRNCWCCERAS